MERNDFDDIGKFYIGCVGGTVIAHWNINNIILIGFNDEIIDNFTNDIDKKTLIKYAEIYSKGYRSGNKLE